MQCAFSKAVHSLGTYRWMRADDTENMTFDFWIVFWKYQKQYLRKKNKNIPAQAMRPALSPLSVNLF